VKLTQEVKAFALEQAGRRCECVGKDCRHHLGGGRCKRGLRGDQWKVFWHTESGGATRNNIEAWCLECFVNNFEVPRETVALLSLDVVGYASLTEDKGRRAVTLKSVLRDAADRAASESGGRVVLGRLDDDVLLELSTSRDAVDAARSVCSGFRELARRLDLPIPELFGAIHSGEVTRWRNGLLVGDAVEIARAVRSIAELDQILLTGPAVASLREKVALEPIARDRTIDLPPVGGIWTLQL
jgi:hypothetical protein